MRLRGQPMTLGRSHRARLPATRAASPRRRLRITPAYLFIAPVIFVAGALLFLPLAEAIIGSFFLGRPTTGADRFVGFDGFAALLSDPRHQRAILNSVTWTVGVVFLQFSIGFIAAILLQRRFRGRWLVRTILIIPWAVPGVVAAMIWRLLYLPQIGFLRFLTDPFGVHNVDVLGDPSTSLLGVILAAGWKGFPFWMLIMLAALQTVPKDQLEAAIVDGASDFRAFIHVTIPNIMPVIRTGLLFTAIWTFNYFELVYVMTRGGPVDSSHIIPTLIYQDAFRELAFGDASRLGVISVLILGVMSLFMIREINRREGST